MMAISDPHKFLTSNLGLVEHIWRFPKAYVIRLEPIGSFSQVLCHQATTITIHGKVTFSEEACYFNGGGVQRSYDTRFPHLNILYCSMCEPR